MRGRAEATLRSRTYTIFNSPNVAIRAFYSDESSLAVMVPRNMFMPQ